jgi:hypothetical protein
MEKGINDLTGLGKIIDSEVAKEAYKDGVADALKEVGGLAADVLKGLRCITLPFVLAGRWRERLLRDIEECRKKVPDERQVESPPEIAGPIIERIRFIEDTNPLRQMFLNLLTASINKERQRKAHPAFVMILSQMSRDEAVLLKLIATSDVRVSHMVQHAAPLYSCSSTSEFASLQELPAAINHLDSLGLVSEGTSLFYDGGVGATKVTLTEFGEKFADACMEIEPPKRADVGE